MRDVLDTRPAYVITTSASNARGTRFGEMVHVITYGQIAQHILHLEPENRAAARIAQGRHSTAVHATDQFKAQLVSLPVNVTTTTVVGPATVDSVLSRDRAAAADYRRAVAEHDDTHDAVVDASDAWVQRRMDLRRLRLDGVDGVEPLPADLAEALTLIEG